MVSHNNDRANSNKSSVDIKIQETKNSITRSRSRPLTRKSLHSSDSGKSTYFLDISDDDDDATSVATDNSNDVKLQRTLYSTCPEHVVAIHLLAEQMNWIRMRLCHSRLVNLFHKIHSTLKQWALSLHKTVPPVIYLPKLREHYNKRVIAPAQMLSTIDTIGTWNHHGLDFSWIGYRPDAAEILERTAISVAPTNLYIPSKERHFITKLPETFVLGHFKITLAKLKEEHERAASLIKESKKKHLVSVVLKNVTDRFPLPLPDKHKFDPSRIVPSTKDEEALLAMFLEQQRTKDNIDHDVKPDDMTESDTFLIRKKRVHKLSNEDEKRFLKAQHLAMAYGKILSLIESFE